MSRGNHYHFDTLVKVHPALASYVVTVDTDHQTIDFADPLAVRALNFALLKKDYGLTYYDLPDDNLVPAVPGRWKYINCIAAICRDLGANKHAKMHLLDIGTGANVIYPLLAHKGLRWTAVGSDISKESLTHAQFILDQNGITSEAVRLVHQDNPKYLLQGIIEDIDYIDAVLFNPPFYDNGQAQDANILKSKNLGREVSRNFAGKSHEIACDGGELRILTDYIRESAAYPHKVYVYTCLVSQGKNLKLLQRQLKELNVPYYDTISLNTSNKKGRILYWSWLQKKQAMAWRAYRWK